MEPNIYTWGKKKQQHIKLYSTRTKGEKKDLQECKSSCLCCLQEIFIDVAELKWLVVTSVASGFALAPKERQRLEHLVCLFLNVQNKKKKSCWASRTTQLATKLLDKPGQLPRFYFSEISHFTFMCV